MQNTYNRTAIFVFYDKDGIVDDYKIYYLCELAKECNKILIVVNGNINDDGMAKLSKYGDVIVRDNHGFDVEAYKFGVLQLKPMLIEACDELILCNDTVFGPFYPFMNIFNKMNQQENVDLWGITKGYEHTAIVNNEATQIREHIHSYFIAIRKRILMSDDFWNFWEQMSKIESYLDAVYKFECVFTNYFHELGYQYQTYVHMDNYSTCSPDPLSLMTTRLLTHENLPVIKRRDFYSKVESSMLLSIDNEVKDTFEYVQSQTNYDVNMIWDTILRNGNLYYIWKKLCLTSILPINNTYTEKDCLERMKIGVFCHIYRVEMAEFFLENINLCPPHSHLFITTDSEGKKTVLSEVFKRSNLSRISIEVCLNRGRGEGALLVQMKKHFLDYDIACIVHDKDSPYTGNSSYTTAYGFAYKIYENMFKTSDYVSNILNLFAKEERLGVVMPPEPNHSFYDSAFAHLWTVPENPTNTQELLDRVGVNITIDPTVHPVYPAGGMLWCRPTALQKLFDYSWSYDDFPSEPIMTDGTLLHAIERSYCYIAQDAGFYSSFIMNSEFASLEYGNIKYNLQDVYSKIRIEFLGKGINFESTLNNELSKMHLPTHNIRHSKNLFIRMILWSYRLLTHPLRTVRYFKHKLYAP